VGLSPCSPGCLTPSPPSRAERTVEAPAFRPGKEALPNEGSSAPEANSNASVSGHDVESALTERSESEPSAFGFAVRAGRWVTALKGPGFSRAAKPEEFDVLKGLGFSHAEKPEELDVLKGPGFSHAEKPEEFDVLKGHGFSRAEKDQPEGPHLAAAGPGRSSERAQPGVQVTVRRYCYPRALRVPCGELFLRACPFRLLIGICQELPLRIRALPLYQGPTLGAIENT